MELDAGGFKSGPEICCMANTQLCMNAKPPIYIYRSIAQICKKLDVAFRG